MQDIFTSLLVALSSSIKFGFTALAAIGSDLGWMGSFSSIAGALVGVVLFTYLGNIISRVLVQNYPARFGRKFSRTTRMMVHVKSRFGLAGLAFITPVFLSIPVGVIFALSLTQSKMKVIGYMSASCLMWALFMFTPYLAFGLNVKRALLQMVSL